ncbi:MAG: ATP-binding protein [bacterium]
MNVAELSPNPYYLIEAMRRIGYTLETALADIFDNSITANAKRISVQFRWNGGTPWIAILDDGHGMSRDVLLDAMRFGGGQSPLVERVAQDLGRFGLGMKTASLSQCRVMTVVSKCAQEINACAWDIDVLKKTEKWLPQFPKLSQLRDIENLGSVFDWLDKSKSGTAIIWQTMDNGVSDEKHFNAAMSRAREHIEVVFHRFIAGSSSHRSVAMDFNCLAVVPFNPFGLNHPARQELTEERVKIQKAVITIQPYVLPHYSKISRQDYEKFGGDEGYLHNQGFYVYRNRRLILKGTWFRLIPRTELTKLIRVRVDIPNTLDHLWHLDIKKSQATPPKVVLDALQKIILKIECRGKDVHKRRAARLADNLTYVWRRTVADGNVCYEINEEHPLVKTLVADANGQIDNRKLASLRVISDAFPRNTFYADTADDKTELVASAEESQVFEAIRSLIDALRNAAIDDTAIKEQLSRIELPISKEKLVELITERKQNG